MTEALGTTGIVSGGARLVCDVSGEGTPVVLVHAGIADARMWDPLLPALTAVHRVIRYDLRGYGRSSLPAGTFSHADDLAAVISSFADGPVHLVGASLGGRVSLDLALARPDLVRSLTLLGAVVPGFDPDTGPPAGWADVEAADRADDVDALADAEARMWLADPDGTRLPPGVLDLVRAMNRTALVNERSGVGTEPEPEPVVGRLGELDLPVLVVVGSLDLADVRLTAGLLAERVRGAEHVVVDGAAHLPALEKPAEVGAVLRRFLARLE
ncbi:MAG: putative aminoacrylate hydrolase RutD [Blastococcus sp.]|nr:putative aminoacrylate hydrolase RutD [Blastococcus sp.]